MKKYNKKYWVFRFLFLAAYLGASGVLIVEAATPGTQSAQQSNAVGGAIGGIVNDMGGDQAKEIMPISVKITNAQTDFRVGDSVLLSLETKPSDATYKAYTYSSSNEELATVDETGLVSFLKAGEVKITATNEKVETVTDEIYFWITNIPVTRFESTIVGVEPDSNNIYQLEVNKTYKIKNIIEPDNATFKDVTYDLQQLRPFISLTDDTIKVLEASGDEIIVLSAGVDGIAMDMHIQTYEQVAVIEDYPLEGLKASNTTKYIDQTGYFTPSISYIPSYTSNKYRGYELSTEDTELIIIQSDKKSLKITGAGGTATIVATSTYDRSKTASFTVTIKERPAISSISVSGYSSSMYVNSSASLYVSVNPRDAITTKTFTSSNSSILTVTSAGRVTAKAVGTASITVKVTDSYGNEKTKTINIEVKEKPTNAATDFVINYKQGENPIVFADEEMNLDSYFGIKSFIGNSASLNANNFNYEFEADEEIGVYASRKYTPHSVGQIKGIMSFTNEDGSVIYKEISFISMDRFEIQYEDTKVTSTLEFPVYSTNIVKIVDQGKYPQGYEVSSSNADITEATLSSKSITIFSKELGDVSITVTPRFTQEEKRDIDLAAKSLSFNVSTKEVFTTTLDVNITHKDGSSANEEDIISLYMNDELKVDYLIDKYTTHSDVVITADNDNVMVRNDKIIPRQIGNSIITVKDNCSLLEKSYHVAVRNKVIINPSKYFILSDTCIYDAESNTVTITNGNTGKIAFNFTSDTTYKTTRYSIGDREVALIGKDGTITPLKVGDTTITMVIEDRLVEHIRVTINLKVVRKNYITNMSDFFYKIRKALGHFGAFAVLGLIGAVMFWMWFREKLFPVGVVLNFGCGFGIAALTEVIQTVTPGRYGCWSDIWLDFSGFSLAAAVATLTFVAIWVIKLVRKHLKAKKEAKTDEQA